MSARIFGPNYTQVPNIILDRLQNFSKPVLKVLLLVCRQTFGWQRTQAILSLTFIENGTGLSRQSVVDALEELVQCTLLKKTPSGRTFIYELVIDDECEILIDKSRVGLVQETEPNSLMARLSTGGGSLTIRPLSVSQEDGSIVHQEDTKKETVLKKEKDISVASAPEPSGPTSAIPAKTVSDVPSDLKTGSGADPRHTKFIGAWGVAHVEIFGDRYRFMGGKDASMLKRLLKSDPDITVEQLITVASGAWRNKKAFHCRNSTSIAYFCSNFNAIKRELETPVVATVADRIEARKKLEAEQKRLEAEIADIERFTKEPVYRTKDRMVPLERFQRELLAVQQQLAAL